MVRNGFGCFAYEHKAMNVGSNEIRRCDVHDSDTIGIPCVRKQKARVGQRQQGSKTDIITSKTARDHVRRTRRRRDKTKGDRRSLALLLKDKFRRCHLEKRERKHSSRARDGQSEACGDVIRCSRDKTDRVQIESNVCESSVSFFSRSFLETIMNTSLRNAEK